MKVLPELEPPFKTITGFTRSTIAGRCKEALHRSGRTELALNESHIELPPVSGGWGGRANRAGAGVRRSRSADGGSATGTGTKAGSATAGYAGSVEKVRLA